MTPLPWHEQQWRIVQDSHKQGRLPHALLLTGPDGLGKSLFAAQLAQRLLCQQLAADGQACGSCRTCLLFKAGSHPDFKRVSPPEDKKTITVDQIREVGHYLSLKSQYALAKVVVVEPADAMNINASNSLLKTLEEPTPDALLILVSSQPAQLPATIRSRCQLIRFSCADIETAQSWLSAELTTQGDKVNNVDLLLSLSDGAPLRALSLHNEGGLAAREVLLKDLEQLTSGRLDPVSLAQQWQKNGVETALYWLQRWIIDMMRLKSCGEMPFVANVDVVQRLQALASPLTQKRLLSLADKVAEGKVALERNLNPQLVLEGLLIEWCNSFLVKRKAV